MSITQRANGNFLGNIQNYFQDAHNAVSRFLPEISSVVAGIAATVFTYEFLEKLADPEGDTTFPLLGVATVSVLHSAVKYRHFADERKYDCLSKEVVRALKSVSWMSFAGVSLTCAIQFGKSAALQGACNEYTQMAWSYSQIEGASGCERLNYCENGSNWMDSCLYFKNRAMNECIDLMSQNSTYFQCFVEEGGQPWLPDNWEDYPYGTMGGTQFQCQPNITTAPINWNRTNAEYIEGYPFYYECTYPYYPAPTYTGKMIFIRSGDIYSVNLSEWCQDSSHPLFGSGNICQPSTSLSHIWPDGALVFSDQFFKGMAKIQESIPEANEKVYEHDNCTVINPYLGDYLYAEDKYERLLSAQYAYSKGDSCSLIEDRAIFDAVLWGTPFFVWGFFGMIVFLRRLYER